MYLMGFDTDLDSTSQRGETAQSPAEPGFSRASLSNG